MLYYKKRGCSIYNCSDKCGWYLIFEKYFKIVVKCIFEGFLKIKYIYFIF